MDKTHTISVQCAVEFETRNNPSEYPISGYGSLSDELNSAVRHVLGRYYSVGKIDKPQLVIPFVVSVEE